MSDQSGGSIEDVFAAAAAEGQIPADEGEPDTAQAPEEPAYYLGTYRDRDSAEQGLAEKERMIGELGNRAGDAERRLAELEQQLQYQQQQPQQQWQQVDDGPRDLSQAELLQVNQSIQALKNEGRTDEALELQLNLSEVIRQRERWEDRQEIEQWKAQVEGPVRQMRGDAAAKSEIEKAKVFLGPNADQLLNDNRQFVTDFVDSFPNLLESNGTLSPRAAEFLAAQVLGADALRRQRGGEAPPRNDQGQFVPVSGGSGAEPSQDTLPQTDTLEPGDPRLAFAQTVKKDAFGTIPSFAGQ